MRSDRGPETRAARNSQKTLSGAVSEENDKIDSLTDNIAAKATWPVCLAGRPSGRMWLACLSWPLPCFAKRPATFSDHVTYDHNGHDHDNSDANLAFPSVVLRSISNTRARTHKCPWPTPLPPTWPAGEG